MKINEAEQLVGITKKNIRYYEECGLLTPKRQVQNGYRDYSEEDVEMLRRIKLLRKLAVPIEEIKRLQSHRMTLEDCLRRHEITLAREEKNIGQIREICAELMEREASFEELPTQALLNEMEEKEKGGTRLMNVAVTDRKAKKKIAPVTVAVLVIVLMGSVTMLMLYAMFYPESAGAVPIPFAVCAILAPLAVIVGILLALRERCKEIRGGEEDAAAKY